MIQQHLRRPTAMPYGTNLHLFQMGIKPVWEDEAFTNGCHISIKAQKYQTSKYWEDLLLAMLGEQFTDENVVVGMVLKLRPMYDRIDIWMRDSTDAKAVANAKSDVARMIQVPESELEFEVFKEIQQKDAEKKKHFNNKATGFKKFSKDQKNEEGGLKRPTKAEEEK